MAPTAKRVQVSRARKIYKLLINYRDKFLTREYISRIIFDPSLIWIAASVLFIAEVFVSILVIERVKYTEIDWVAYMQEVEGVVNGTWDYTKLKGDTGPLVYPAGFVYFFMALYYLTGHGQNIRLAQYIFAGLYLIVLFLVFRIYGRSKKIPPYVLIFLCCTSYRVHSIFILRMFNDPVAMLFLYAAINLFLDNRWNLGSLMYSVAVSIKMNILLFAPALLLVYLTSLGYKGTALQLAICAAVQVVLAVPFLLVNPVGYVVRAFNLGRVFLFQWTVNWRFLPEEIFVNSYFHIALLSLHALILLLFFESWFIYLRSYASFTSAKSQMKKKLKKEDAVDMGTSSQLLLLPLFVSNFIGIACSRSLHYQFYVWYFHTLPYLLWSVPFSVPLRLAILGIIEMCWNTYPSTSISSALLHMCHIIIICGLYRSRITEKKVEDHAKAS